MGWVMREGAGTGSAVWVVSDERADTGSALQIGSGERADIGLAVRALSEGTLLVGGVEYRFGDGDGTRSGGANAVHNMSSELVLIPLDHAHQRHRRDLPESTQRELDDVFARAFDEREVVQRAPTQSDSVQYLYQRRISQSAWDAFRAGLVAIEGRQIAGEVHDADMLIEDHPATRAEHTADIRQ